MTRLLWAQSECMVKIIQIKFLVTFDLAQAESSESIEMFLF